MTTTTKKASKPATTTKKASKPATTTKKVSKSATTTKKASKPATTTKKVSKITCSAEWAKFKKEFDKLKDTKSQIAIARKYLKIFLHERNLNALRLFIEDNTGKYNARYTVGKVQVIESDKYIDYQIGQFSYLVDGNWVIVTKKDGKSIQSIATYTYATKELAQDYAFSMAKKQSKA